jgi:hypothetical protein
MHSLLHSDPETLRLAHPPPHGSGTPRTFTASKRRRVSRRRLRIAVLPPAVVAAVAAVAHVLS